jgi:flagellin-like protein
MKKGDKLGRILNNNSKRSNSRSDIVIKKNILSMSKRSTRVSNQLSSIKLLPNSKLSQSEVVSTVLLIMITVVAVTVIIAFVIPFVKKQLSGSDCLEVANKLEVVNNIDYTCYDNDVREMHVQIHVGDVGSDKINGFLISVGSASSSAFRIINNTGTTGIKMYNGNDVLEVPGKDEERTYNISGITTKPSKIKITPVLVDGRTCESAGVLNRIEFCS